MLLKLAWRNIWRNTRRTVISVLAISLGVTAIVALVSFREVATQAMFRSITDGLVGDVQVSARGYHDSPELSHVVHGPDAVAARLAAAYPGATVEQRVLGGGLAGHGDAASPVMVMGIQPDQPAVASQLEIESGRALATKPAHEVVIGTGLASTLGVGPGGELVLVGQAADGSLANDLYQVVGTADVGTAEANASTVFLHLADAQSFFALRGGVHELIVRLPVAPEELARPVARLRAAVDEKALEVMPWTEILPELKAAIDSKRKNQGAVTFVVFLIVALGVLNTMTMSTFERTRELGVLASLGTRRRRILGMVVLEALLQGVIGFVLGVVLAYVLLRVVGTVDLSSMMGGGDVAGARLPGALRPAVYPPALLSAGVTTVLTMLAGGLIPAIRASRLKPVEATRYV